MNELNKHMANKAVAQIKLNETRDVLRDTNQAVSVQKFRFNMSFFG